MEITFSNEKLRDIRAEIEPLIAKNFDELGIHENVGPLNINWPLYYQLEEHGLMHLTIARAAGHLIGYCNHIIHQSLHYAQLHAAECDLIYLDKPERQAWNGVRLIRAQENALIALGVNYVIFKEKLFFKNDHGRRIGRLLGRIGYKLIEHVHARRI